MANFAKSLLILAIALLAFLQTAYADIYSQLSFIKIVSPNRDQDVRAGEPLQVKYIMQPLNYNDGINVNKKLADGVSAGRALKMDINFHARTGTQKQQQLAIIHKECPVAAKEKTFVTYTKQWIIPKDTKPGSYAVDFVEEVQFRRGRITATETVPVNVVA
ncbi:hypothetical protein EC973_000700 [Apophysomyces ossiformis]|uniref:Phosphatidylglycerol/phosphatidylinositol transfer protein n=1 Tax=Apophysomyces ossiformis TaxID=679940 RepID=A0A8H7EPV3_9FUNG|nr:hypothetical protein EC973_000700 [Apophysomyces ossiformis]